MEMNRTTTIVFSAFFIGWLCLSAFGLYFTLPPTDEGMLLSAVKRFSDGETPYKDFFLYLPPVSLLVGLITDSVSWFTFLPRMLTIFTSFISLILYHKYLIQIFENSSTKLVKIGFFVYVISNIPISFLYTHHSLHHFLFTILLLTLSHLQSEITEKNKKFCY